MSARESLPWHIILFITVMMMLVVFICSGCLGVGTRGKSMRIQVPALLDVEIDYVEDTTPPIEEAGKWRDFYVPKKDTIKSIFGKPDDNATD
tara:strand:- start:151 stop:426 length:276 start_codon:yes stop_codon:yes gene_type:complete